MISVNTSQRRLSQGKYKQLCPCFLCNNKEVIERTLEAMTQFGRLLLAIPLMRNTYRSPFPANNALRRNEAVAMDSVKACMAAINIGGIKEAQFYISCISRIADAFRILSEKEFVNMLEYII